MALKGIKFVISITITSSEFVSKIRSSREYVGFKFTGSVDTRNTFMTSWLAMRSYAQNVTDTSSKRGIWWQKEFEFQLANKPEGFIFEAESRYVRKKKSPVTRIFVMQIIIC